MSKYIDRKQAFWDALGALTFAETLEVAEVFRDAGESFGDYDPSVPADWVLLLNTAREVAEDREA